MSAPANAELGWKIAFIVLLTAVVAAGATYLVLEARRPPLGVAQVPVEAAKDELEQAPAASEGTVSGVETPVSSETPSGEGGIPLPPLVGADLLSARGESAAPEIPEPSATASPESPEQPQENPPATTAPGVQMARDALARGELHRSVLLLDQLEATPEWQDSGAIKVLEEDILATLEAADAGLSIAQRQGIQQALMRLGYDPGGVDGVFGSSTRRAIRAYQSARDQRATGYLTEIQLGQLLGEAATQQQAQDAQQQARILELRGEAEGLLQAGDLHTSLVRVQEGLQLAPENPELTALQENLQRRLTETDLALNQQERQRVQFTLQELGYNVREQDGVFGQTTRAAIAAYQRQIGQPSTGYLTETALQQLLYDAAETEQSAAIKAQEQLSELLNTTRDLLARSDPYQDEALLREQLARVVAAQDHHPRDQELLGLELELRARLEEVGLALNEADRRAIQTDLSRLGFDTRGVDGHLGPGTREAVAAYQRSRGLPTTGYLSRPMLNQLWQDAQSLQAQRPAATPDSTGSLKPGSGTVSAPASNPAALLEMMDRELRNLQQRTDSPSEGQETETGNNKQSSATDAAKGS